MAGAIDESSTDPSASVPEPRHADDSPRDRDSAYGNRTGKYPAVLSATARNRHEAETAKRVAVLNNQIRSSSSRIGLDLSPTGSHFIEHLNYSAGG